MLNTLLCIKANDFIHLKVSISVTMVRFSPTVTAAKALHVAGEASNEITTLECCLHHQDAAEMRRLRRFPSSNSIPIVILTA